MTNVVDLDDFVYAWLEALAGYNTTQDLIYTIDWSRVNVTSEKPIYTSAGQTSPHSVILFKSTFDNDSSEKQKNSFSAQSKYTSSGSVSLHQCFTLDGRTKVDLSLPGPVVNATSGFGQKLSITSARSQAFEKEQTWNVNTKIVVPERASITAQQTLQLTKYSSDFSVVTVISGKVRVTSRSANGSEVFIDPKKIAEIVHEYKNSLPHFAQTDGRTIRVTSRGRCELTYGIEQHVTVSSYRR